MANLYRNSSDARAISKGFNMLRYGENRRTDEPTFSVIESMTYCFSIFFLRKLNFFAVPESRQIESHYKKFATGDFFFFNWIWNLNIVFHIKEVSFHLIQKHIPLAQFSFGANYKLFDGISFSTIHLS